MLLSTFASEVYLPSRISVKRDYANNVLATCRRFSAHAGHEMRVSELSETAICSYLCAYRKRWKARSTNNERQLLLMLWRAAHARGLTPTHPHPDLIRVLPLDRQPPQAWRLEEVHRILEQCRGLHGEVCGIPEHLYATALIQTIYWTGSRIKAVLDTPANCYSPGEGLLIPTPKNQHGEWHTLPPDCCAAIDATEPDTRDMLFPWALHRSAIFKRMRKLIEAAGLEAPKVGKNLFHRLRRTTLSYCAAVDPAIAQRQAGHADYATTLRHYIDPRIAHQRSAADVLPDPLRPTPNSSATPHLRIVG
jgi:integrase